MRTEASKRAKVSGTGLRHLLTGIVALAAVAATPMAAPAARAQSFANIPTSGLAAAVTGSARPLPAWAEFCERYAAECAVDRVEPAAVTLTPARWQTINSVNRRVNRAVHAVTDQEHWGVPDRWDLAEDGQGDCEDFQLRKRQLLADAGLPRRAMRMTVVVDEKGDGHAVLTVVTDRGDLVLDNKTNAVLPWRQTGYTFIKRESQDALAWVGLGAAVSPVTTANR